MHIYNPFFLASQKTPDLKEGIFSRLFKTEITSHKEYKKTAPNKNWQGLKNQALSALTGVSRFKRI
jgi:hypothetical protein